MKKLQVRLMLEVGDTLAVGLLAEQRGRVYFEYEPEFLATGLNLSPFRLPFEPGLFEHRDREFSPLPGLFDDSLPDGWGLLLMDRKFRAMGQDLAVVSPLDRLAWLGTRTMGALTYHPPAEREEVDSSVFDLYRLAQHAQAVLTGSAVEVLPALLRAGGSPGGALPKVLIGFNVSTGEVISGEDDLPEGFTHWIVKFAAEADDEDAGPLEYAYSVMARAAGLEISPSRLFETAEGACYFGVERFDRTGNRRTHIHTFGNLIHSDFRIPSADYSDLLKVTSLLTRDHRQVLRAYRQMVFNVFSHNRDDHVKNFAFLLDDKTGDWLLSPAYDLFFSSGPGGEHSMTLAGEGKNPGRSELLSLAKLSGISRRDAASIIDHVREAVACWPKHAAEAGVSQACARRVEISLREVG